MRWVFAGALSVIAGGGALIAAVAALPILERDAQHRDCMRAAHQACVSVMQHWSAVGEPDTISWDDCMRCQTMPCAEVPKNCGC